MNDDQVKDILNHPDKLDEGLKKLFEEMDKDKKGYVSFDVVHHSLHKAIERYGKVVKEEDHKPGELEGAEKICDPKGTGKVEYEGFKALVLAAMKFQLEHGHHH